MGELARTLQHEHASEDATLEAVTAAAVEAVAGAEHAAISLVVRGRTVESRAATDPLAERMDAKQAELSQGPCLDAVWEQESVHIPDMAAESRWPQFTAAAVEGVPVRNVSPAANADPLAGRFRCLRCHRGALCQQRPSMTRPSTTSVTGSPR